MGGETCFMRWENRISCELRRGHVGAHTNLKIGLCWWGQVLLDPIPGSFAGSGNGGRSAQVKEIPPDWADETRVALSALDWDDEPAIPKSYAQQVAESAAQRAAELDALASVLAAARPPPPVVREEKRGGDPTDIYVMGSVGVIGILGLGISAIANASSEMGPARAFAVMALLLAASAFILWTLFH